MKTAFKSFNSFASVILTLTVAACGPIEKTDSSDGSTSSNDASKNASGGVIVKTPTLPESGLTQQQTQGNYYPSAYPSSLPSPTVGSTATTTTSTAQTVAAQDPVISQLPKDSQMSRKPVYLGAYCVETYGSAAIAKLTVTDPAIYGWTCKKSSDLNAQSYSIGSKEMWSACQLSYRNQLINVSYEYPNKADSWYCLVDSSRSL